MTLAALGQESGIIGYPIRRECDEVCGEMEVRQPLQFRDICHGRRPRPNGAGAFFV